MVGDDAVMATLARHLAETLMRYARERRPDDQKEIARLHTELCRVYRDEQQVEDADGTPG